MNQNECITKLELIYFYTRIKKLTKTLFGIYRVEIQKF